MTNLNAGQLEHSVATLSHVPMDLDDMVQNPMSSPFGASKNGPDHSNWPLIEEAGQCIWLHGQNSIHWLD